MVVWASLETTCPFCKERLRVREVGGGFAVGQDSDLFVRMSGKHIIQAEIHTCANCRFSGYASDFTDTRVSPATIKRYLNEVAHRLQDEEIRENGNSHVSRIQGLSTTPLPHVQYYWSALAGPVIGLTPSEIGRRLVKAYWCLRVTPSADLPDGVLQRLRKRYLRESIALLRQGLRREKNRVMVYLLGELCRRNGNFGLAAQYFERFLYREEGPGYLKQAAGKLLVTSRGEDSAERTMEEVLSDREHGSRAAER